MRTRNQTKLKKEEPTEGDSTAKSHDEEGSLAKISKEAVGKLLSRVKSRRGRKDCRPSDDTSEKLSKENGKENEGHIQDFGLKGCTSEDAVKSTSDNAGVVEGSAASAHGDANEMDWEEGSISVPEFWEGYSHKHGREVTIEFTDSPSAAQKKRPRRASAEDKELAELVHKVHLLCLLARGRLVDNACNDPLIQASILSLLPSYLLKTMEVPRLKANMLGSLVRWFHENFHIRSGSIDRGSFYSNLAYALEAREGTAEEVAALSVALFRALNLRTRYCMQWYKIAPRRINSDWWDTVLAPLKELESGENGGIVDTEAFQENTSSELDKKSLEPAHPASSNPLKSSSTLEYSENESLPGGASIIKQDEKAFTSESPSKFPKFSCGISLEDMELEIRSLTEPLPTNQLAYKSHHLYVIEKWLTKHQILHPRGPVLGYCSGHPVYPRSCVQTLQTKHRWLREGFQVKADETPAKVVKRSKKNGNVQICEPDISEEVNGETTIELYGKWQLEPLQLPCAINGIVPKNEWRRVDVWSEKCLPPGTIHLRLPRLAAVARRLDIDFAPAMVGFEFRNGRSFPVYDGIVVCTEFRNAIMEAYEEEEERRESEERKRNETQALSRWFQLLSSIVTRQRLQNSYVDSSSLHTSQDLPNSLSNNKDGDHSYSFDGDRQSRGISRQNTQDAKSILPLDSDHVHIFPTEKQSFDEESMIRTKRCPCGFSIQVEEL